MNLNQALKTAAELHHDRVDGRSKGAQRFKQIYSSLSRELGRGEGDDLPASTAQLLRRATTLAMLTEQEEARLARGEPIDALVYVRASGALHRMLVALGLEPEVVGDTEPGGRTIHDIIGAGAGE